MKFFLELYWKIEKGIAYYEIVIDVFSKLMRSFLKGDI